MNKQVKRPSIFGIGLSRTGTTSLAKALKILGYASCHWPCSMDAFNGQDALTDITVSCRFKQLDQMFPGSKFIYTVRDHVSWLESCKIHWAKIKTMRTESKIPGFAEEAELSLYGTLEFEPDKLSTAYYRHHDSVLEYFKNRQTDLLVLNIVGGEGWEKLCPFLGKHIPLVKFPCMNTRAQ